VHRKSLWLVTLAYAPLLVGGLLLNTSSLKGQNAGDKPPSPQEDKEKKNKDDLSKQRTTTRVTKATAKDTEKTAKTAARDTERASKKVGSRAQDSEWGAKTAAKDIEKGAKKTDSMKGKSDKTAAEEKKN